jgi:hypothetical protein
MIPVLFLQMLAEQKQPYESVKQGKFKQKSDVRQNIFKQKTTEDHYDHKYSNVVRACTTEMKSQ